MTARSWRTCLVAVCLVLVAGCTTLPESGEVHQMPAVDESRTSEQPYFQPPGPAKGASPAKIVEGFLLAMQANPLSTAVARQFLSAQARQTWKPNTSTITFEARTIEQAGEQVSVRLTDAHRLDSRGGWLGGPQGSGTVLDLQLVQDEGQWRIDNPVDALVVESQFFEGRFEPFQLYFFDRTNRVLVPDTVYIPRGKQTATNLVRGLLAGPGRDLAPVVRSAFPGRTDVDFSVVVTDKGLAEVPLTAEILKLSPAELNRVVVQLAWTLRQVPGISRVRITTDGAPVALPDGGSDFSVNEGMEFNPAAGVINTGLLALRNGRAVVVAGGSSDALNGPFGRAGFALRAVTPNPDGDAIAAVTANGRTVFVGPRMGATTGVRTVLKDGTDVLRPTYDLFGDLWLVDRTARGAVVHHVRGGRDRVVNFPGISGKRLSAFTVARDGTRLVATLAGEAKPVVMIGDILRAADGNVVSSSIPARLLPLIGSDLGGALDVGWVSPTSLAILTRAPGADSRIVYIQADGSPGDGRATVPDSFPGRAVSMATSVDPALPLFIVTANKLLFELSSTGRWSSSPVVVGITSGTYAG